MLKYFSNEVLQKAISHINFTCDLYALISASTGYIIIFSPNDELIELQNQRQELFARIKQNFGAIKHADDNIRKQYSKLCYAIKTTKVQRRKQADKVYRREYFDNIHTVEIERQGKDFKEVAFVEPTVDHQLQERKDIQAVMCTMSEPISIDTTAQRILAVESLTALCRRREGQRRMQRRATKDDERKQASKAFSPIHNTNSDEDHFVDPFPMLLDPRQCPVCIKDEGLSHWQRTYHFHNIWNMWDHAETHFRDFPGDKPYFCRHPKCNGELLNNTTHFKNHCETQHNCRLRA